MERRQNSSRRTAQIQKNSTDTEEQHRYKAEQIQKNSTDTKQNRYRITAQIQKNSTDTKQNRYRRTAQIQNRTDTEEQHRYKTEQIQKSSTDTKQNRYRRTARIQKNSTDPEKQHGYRRTAQIQKNSTDTGEQLPSTESNNPLSAVGRRSSAIQGHTSSVPRRLVGLGLRGAGWLLGQHVQQARRHPTHFLGRQSHVQGRSVQSRHILAADALKTSPWCPY